MEKKFLLYVQTERKSNFEGNKKRIENGPTWAKKKEFIPGIWELVSQT